MLQSEVGLDFGEPGFFGRSDSLISGPFGGNQCRAEEDLARVCACRRT